MGGSSCPLKRTGSSHVRTQTVGDAGIKRVTSTESRCWPGQQHHLRPPPVTTDPVALRTIRSSRCPVVIDLTDPHTFNHSNGLMW
jgi:hypothetical protein